MKYKLKVQHVATGQVWESLPQEVKEEDIKDFAEGMVNGNALYASICTFSGIIYFPPELLKGCVIYVEKCLEGEDE